MEYAWGQEHIDIQLEPNGQHRYALMMGKPVFDLILAEARK